MSAHLRDQVNDLTKSSSSKEEGIADNSLKEVSSSEVSDNVGMEVDQPKVSTSGPRDNNRNKWAKKHLKKGKRAKNSNFSKFLKKK